MIRPTLALILAVTLAGCAAPAADPYAADRGQPLGPRVIETDGTRGLPDNRVATVTEGEGIGALAIDDGELLPAETHPGRGDTLRLLPGDRRLIVDFEEDAGEYWSYSINGFSLRHALQPGRRYRLSAVRQSVGDSEVVTPVLVEETAGDDGRLVLEPVAGPELTAGPIDVRPPVGGATVRGFAGVALVDGPDLTGTGRRVVLLPIGDAAGRAALEEWLLETGKRAGDTPPGWERRRETIGYGLGQFQFRDVPLGRYAALFVPFGVSEDYVSAAGPVLARRDVVVSRPLMTIDGVQVGDLIEPTVDPDAESGPRFD